MEFEGIMPSEGSQRENHKYCKISLIRRNLKNEQEFHCGAVETNLTRKHEFAGSIPGSRTVS